MAPWRGVYGHSLHPLHTGLPWGPTAPRLTVLCADGVLGGGEEATREPGDPAPQAPAVQPVPLGQVRCSDPRVPSGLVCAPGVTAGSGSQAGPWAAAPSYLPSFSRPAPSTCCLHPSCRRAWCASHDTLPGPSLPSLGDRTLPQGSTLASGRGIGAGLSAAPAFRPSCPLRTPCCTVS